MIDRATFEREALPELGHLAAYARRLCHDSQEAADLVQETMVRACQYFRTYRAGSNCRAWLFQICKNAYINDYRRRHYAPVPLDVCDGADPDTDFPVGTSLRDEADTVRHQGWLGDEVVSALQSLPQTYQTAVILSDLEGHTYEEISSFTATPIGTIRSRIHRGRRMLAAMLQPYAASAGWGRPQVVAGH